MKKNGVVKIKCYDLIKKVFNVVMSFFSCNALKFVSMNNQICKVRPEILNINSNEPLFQSLPCSILVNKCSGSCNNINDLCAKLGIPDVIKNMNIKAFNPMSRANETRHLSWHESCRCRCRLYATIYDNKKRWNNDVGEYLD